MSPLAFFFSGGIMIGSVVAGMFFYRFWSKTGDRLFAIFGSAFWLMAVERLVLVSVPDFNSEADAYVYLIRLGAFALILYGILDKNRSEKSS